VQISTFQRVKAMVNNMLMLVFGAGGCKIGNGG
jgi:hypothetical protein